VIVAAPTHPLVSERCIARSTLMREAFVVREKGSDTWRSMEEGLAADMDDLRIAMEIRSTETIKQAVMAGMGISFLSAHTVSRELSAGSLCVLDVDGLPLMLNWYVVHLRDKRLQPVTQAFKDFLLEDGAALIEQIVPFTS
jgi:DNA-binding transcriptional LysR family regulator